MTAKHIAESLQTSVAGRYDVIVGGAGPAGVAAALAAARTGASVLLIEANGCLGGIWTAGLLCWVIDADRPGIIQTIRQQLEAAGARGQKRFSERHWTYDPEIMKRLLEQMCMDANISIRLHTRIVAVAKQQDQRTLRAVLTESRSGREAWEAKQFIDCTGDGELACRAGCAFAVGHPTTGDVQPASMTMLITGVRFSEIEPFVGGGLREPKIRLAQEIRDAGWDPSYRTPVIFPIYDDLFAFVPNHQYDVHPGNADLLTKATIEARAECHAIVNALRQRGGCWQDLRIVATTEHLGMREGRRIQGLYTVMYEDLLSGARQEDAICRVTMNVDVHNAKRTDHRLSSKNRKPIQPYDIPLRSLIARDADNLWLAGRCISGDFLAHSSYRVTGNAVGMGEAAGVSAALAARKNIQAAHLDYAHVHAALEPIRGS